MRRTISSRMSTLLVPLLGLLAMGAAMAAAGAGSATPQSAAGADDPDGLMAALDRCLDRELRAAEAAPACERAAADAGRLDPGQRAALAHRRGQIALAEGKPAVAVPLLEEAHALEPRVAPYLLTLGDALVASGDIARAAVVYREGQEVAPSSLVFRARLDALPTPPAAAPPAVALR